MTQVELPKAIAAFRGHGYLLAPAGYGKTHLIAESILHTEGRQLILTHTHAGVNALRAKLRALKVSTARFHVDTIASWSLRLCLAYSSTSGWSSERPESGQWNELYLACRELLDKQFIRRIVRSSYAGMYVDEYQDCSVNQHSIVNKLARDLSCRVLGDPMQGIFDIGDQSLVDWENEVERKLEPLGTLDTPHRWIGAGADDLAEWLIRVREALEQDLPIDLLHAIPDRVRVVTCSNGNELFHQQADVCRNYPCKPQESVIAMHKGDQVYKEKCHHLARSIGGRFSSIEEIEGRDLHNFIKGLVAKDLAGERLTEAIGFAEKCMTAVRKSLSAGTLRGEQVEIQAKTKNPKIAGAANDYLDDPTSSNLAQFFRMLKENSNTKVFRRDLFNRLIEVLRIHTSSEALNLSEAAHKFQSEFRRRGRIVGSRKVVSTTLLVKGLEFDHGIILDASSLSSKELYVALTRGSKTLTIISKACTLRPMPNQ